MLLSVIAAVARNRVIGNKNKLPWHLPADLAHFKKLTAGHPVIMGKNTFLSLGKPLPNRTNIVLAEEGYEANGYLITHSIQDAVARASQMPGRAGLAAVAGLEIAAMAGFYLEAAGPLMEKLRAASS